MGIRKYILFVRPTKITKVLKNITNGLNGEIFIVPVVPKEKCKSFDCHNNVLKYGNEVIKGYYVLRNISIGCYELFQHFITKENGDYIDITPYQGANELIFIKCDNVVKRYSYLGGNLLENNQTKETEKNELYYVYALIDPRNGKPFYVGKGKKDRWKVHLNETLENNSNQYKFNKIQKLKRLNYEIPVEFLATNIEDESLAYTIEEMYIKQYGRIQDGGILTNICLNAKPPNQKNKTYEEIYGIEEAKIQKQKRLSKQLEVGGYFKGEKHTPETLVKLSEKQTGVGNGNSSGLSEDDILTHGKLFCKMFDYKISNKKWKYYCEINNIPTLRRTFRFKGEDIFKIFIEKFGAKIVYDSLKWLYNKDLDKRIRMFDWEVNYKGIPEGYVLGRGSYI